MLTTVTDFQSSWLSPHTQTKPTNETTSNYKYEEPGIWKRAIALLHPHPRSEDTRHTDTCTRRRTASSAHYTQRSDVWPGQREIPLSKGNKMLRCAAAWMNNRQGGTASHSWNPSTLEMEARGPET